MAYQNYAEQPIAKVDSPENMGMVLNHLNECAKAARQRASDIEGRLFGRPTPKDVSDGNKLQQVMSVADTIAEARALVGLTLDSLDRIAGQL